MATRTVPARLRRVLRETGWTQADLARVTGADRSTVSRWITDGHKRIDSRYAFRIQDASGFCARWILHGEGPVHSSELPMDRLPDELRQELLRFARNMARILRDATEGGA